MSLVEVFFGYNRMNVFMSTLCRTCVHRADLCLNCSKCSNRIPGRDPSGNACYCTETPDPGEETCKYYKKKEEKMDRSDKFSEQCKTCFYGCNNDYCLWTPCSKCSNRIPEDEAVCPELTCRCSETPDENETTCKYYRKTEE